MADFTRESLIERVQAKLASLAKQETEILAKIVTFNAKGRKEFLETTEESREAIEKAIDSLASLKEPSGDADDAKVIEYVRLLAAESKVIAEQVSEIENSRNALIMEVVEPYIPPSRGFNIANSAFGTRHTLIRECQHGFNRINSQVNTLRPKLDYLKSLPEGMEFSTLKLKQFGLLEVVKNT